MIFGIDRHAPQSPALFDTASGASLSYGQLIGSVTMWSEVLRGFPRSPVILCVAPAAETEALAVYLACLECGYPVLLVENGQAEALDALYRPGLVLCPASLALMTPSSDLTEQPALSPGYRLWTRPEGAAVHPDLALLLQTSGSTGSPKLVRLTRANLESNASSISAYLELSSQEKAIQTLPFSYSYGLSIVNSHLYAGASLVFTPHSFLRPAFWAEVDQHACTSFAGVPFMYETLERLRFDPRKHPSVMTYTQAGGALQVDVASRFGAAVRASGRRFYVMYGQTEASPRISYVPPDRLADKPGSIGIPIPGGHLELAALEGTDCQELIYSGPNVMLGYAEDSADLLLGDQMGGRLPTGDLGRVDEDGYFYITGRLKRFAKLFGLRINLDEVEAWLEGNFPMRTAALEVEGRLKLFVEALQPVEEEKVRFALAAHLALPPAAVAYTALEKLPVKASGKKDRQSLLS